MEKDENLSKMKADIGDRKQEHIEICLSENVNNSYRYWDDIYLIHNALPKIDFDEIDTSITLFGKKLDYPIIIEGMTGGTEISKKINENLARAADSLNIGMGIGSERAALKHPESQHTYSVLKDYNIPLKIANLGAPQLVSQKNSSALTFSDFEKVIDLIDADLVALHLNYLQEIVQPEGDLNAAGVENKLLEFSARYPVIVKETGAGIAKEVALRLKRDGVKGLDVGGAGGTSFSAVEYYRAKNAGLYNKEVIGKLFWDWGIPTPASVYQLRNIGLPVIGSGGLINGLDLAKVFVLGADAGGFAKALLSSATKSHTEVLEKLKEIIDALKAAMFLVSARTVYDLKNKPFIVTGKTKDWLTQL